MAYTPTLPPFRTPEHIHASSPISETAVPPVPGGSPGRRLPQPQDAEGRVGLPHARLFPFLGRKVRTPTGPGTLIQVFAERVTVLLDSERDKCSFFRPAQIEPVSTE